MILIVQKASDTYDDDGKSLKYKLSTCQFAVYDTGTVGT